MRDLPSAHASSITALRIPGARASIAFFPTKTLAKHTTVTTV